MPKLGACRELRWSIAELALVHGIGSEFPDASRRARLEDPQFVDPAVDEHLEVDTKFVKDQIPLAVSRNRLGGRGSIHLDPVSSSTLKADAFSGLMEYRDSANSEH